ncbi:MAG TPA: acyl-CoA dehydrogenase family protein [Acidimicrobiales bacterium]|nr:acyl-CoA dehydrogenase family protein [Acidimicrobiales bacterium]
MDLIVSDEHVELQETLGHLFAQKCPTSLVRRLRVDDGGDELDGLWKSLSAGGFLGLGLPTEFGGGGGSLPDLGVLMHEAGRVVAPQIVKSTILFGLAVLRAGDDELRDRWLRRVCEEQIRAAVVLDYVTPGREDVVQVVPGPSGGWEIAGGVEFALLPAGWEVLLVSALTEDGQNRVLLVVDGSAPGLTCDRYQALGTRDLSKVTFDHVPVEAQDASTSRADDEGVRGHMMWVADALAALESAEAVGGAEAVVDRTVAYITDRVQFDRPIGSFQAAQHHIANVSVAIEGARLAALQALWLVDSASPVELGAALARAVAVSTFKQATLRAHQLHGGLGMTLESDLHLWSERAKLLEVRGELWDDFLERMADTLDTEHDSTERSRG